MSYDNRAESAAGGPIGIQPPTLDRLRRFIGGLFVDIRIGEYADGRPHNHGTAFRVLPDKLDLCFAHREEVM